MSFLNKCQCIWYTPLGETFQWLSTPLGIKSKILPLFTAPCRALVSQPLLSLSLLYSGHGPSKFFSPSQPLLVLSHFCLNSLPPSLCLISTNPSCLNLRLAPQKAFPNSKITNIHSYSFLYLPFISLRLRLFYFSVYFICMMILFLVCLPPYCQFS